MWPAILRKRPEKKMTTVCPQLRIFPMDDCESSESVADELIWTEVVLITPSGNGSTGATVTLVRSRDAKSPKWELLHTCRRAYEDSVECARETYTRITKRPAPIIASAKLSMACGMYYLVCLCEPSEESVVPSTGEADYISRPFDLSMFVEGHYRHRKEIDSDTSRFCERLIDYI